MAISYSNKYRLQMRAHLVIYFIAVLHQTQSETLGNRKENNYLYKQFL